MNAKINGKFLCLGLSCLVSVFVANLVVKQAFARPQCNQCRVADRETRKCNVCGSMTRKCIDDACIYPSGEGYWSPWSSCSGVGVEESKECGNCGRMIKKCSADGKRWSVWSKCMDQGKCQKNETYKQGCGLSGYRIRKCNSKCQWKGDWSKCMNQGVCKPKDTSTRSCGKCGWEERVCNSNGSWGPYGKCNDQGSCMPGDVSIRETELCGKQSQTCSKNCEWSNDWIVYIEQNGSCQPNEEDLRYCIQQSKQTRQCSQFCQWDEWSECTPDIGNCKEGDRFSLEYGNCGVEQWMCYLGNIWEREKITPEGECRPGDVDYQFAGKEIQTRQCLEDCMWGTWHKEACIMGYSDNALLTYAPQFHYETYLDDYLSMLDAWGVKLLRIWIPGWGNSEYHEGEKCKNWEEMLPNVKSDKGYDLEKFDEDYFIRLRELISHAKQRRIIVMLTLFDSWGLKHIGEWDMNPWDKKYNINEVKGDVDFYIDKNKKIRSLQKMLIDQVILYTKDYNNVIYEIMNEPLGVGLGSDAEAKNWHKDIIEHITLPANRPDAIIVVNNGLVRNTLVDGCKASMPELRMKGLKSQITAIHWNDWKECKDNFDFVDKLDELVIIDSDGCSEKSNVDDLDSCFYEPKKDRISNLPANLSKWAQKALEKGAIYNHLPNDLCCHHSGLPRLDLLQALSGARDRCLRKNTE